GRRSRRAPASHRHLAGHPVLRGQAVRPAGEGGAPARRDAPARRALLKRSYPVGSSGIRPFGGVPCPSRPRVSSKAIRPTVSVRMIHPAVSRLTISHPTRLSAARSHTIATDRELGHFIAFPIVGVRAQQVKPLATRRARPARVKPRA